MKKIIGILGGIGPEASYYLYKNIIDYCQKNYKAIQDTDYPNMVINNVGLEGFDETGVVDESLVKKGLLDGIKQLDNAGVNSIYIACNTVHKYYDYLQENSNGNINNLIEITVSKIKDKGHSKILILGSNTTNKSLLYDKYLNQYGINFIKIGKNEQKHIDNIIENVMGGNSSKADFLYIENISKKYKDKGVSAVIIGCTELPLVTNKHKNVLTVFDTIEILTEEISKYAKK